MITTMTQNYTVSEGTKLIAHTHASNIKKANDERVIARKILKYVATDIQNFFGNTPPKHVALALDFINESTRDTSAILEAMSSLFRLSGGNDYGIQAQISDLYHTLGINICDV